MALDKPLDAITAADLQAPITDAVPEGKTVDYKEMLPGYSREDKKKFLADVSSFANASGGLLVFGMREDAGVAVELLGLPGIDADAEILRLENMLRDGVAPRIPGVAMRAISVSPSGVAIVINIPRSWAQPHVVDFQGHWRFYSRNSAGKYPLDVTELRSAFMLSETLAERVRNFRAERLGNIVAGETPLPLAKTAKTVLHIVPTAAFDPALRFDLTPLANNTGRLAPIYAGGWNHRYNLDGLLTYTPEPNETVARGYLQIFRNGSVEAVDTFMLRPRGQGAPLIASVSFEQKLIEALQRFLTIQKEMGVSPPLFIMLSLLGVKGYMMGVDNTFPDDAYPIDRNDLVLPELFVEDLKGDAATIVRPAFDAIWNAAGWPQSMNYNKNGE